MLQDEHTATEDETMSIGWRAITGSLVAYPGIQGAISLGLSLPMNRIDAALTAGTLGFIATAMIVSWIIDATKTLTMLAAAFLPGVAATVLLLIAR